MTFRGLSSVRAKLEPARSENNKILEINVLSKFTPQALYKSFIPRLTAPKCNRVNLGNNKGVRGSHNLHAIDRGH